MNFARPWDHYIVLWGTGRVRFLMKMEMEYYRFRVQKLEVDKAGFEKLTE